jgi:hypothetical protein
MVRKLEQRPTRVRGALDRFGPPLESIGSVLNVVAKDEAAAQPQESLELKPRT